MSYGAPDPFREIRGSIVRAGAPVSIAILGINIILFLADFFLRGSVSAWVDCQLANGAALPIWGLLTYPLLTPDFISLLFAVLWLWMLGGSLERSWGAGRFIAFFIGISLINALSVLAGTRLLHDAGALAGLWLPLTALTCAWAAINPREPMVFYFVLRIEARWMALIMVGIVYFEYFRYNPALGLFALVAPALAWFYVRGNWSIGRSVPRRGPDLRVVGGGPRTLDGSPSRFGPLKWLRERQERKRLEKLWKDSGFSDRNQR
jgi:membrane associated rhomboid family serine protease